MVASVPGIEHDITDGPVTNSPAGGTSERPSEIELLEQWAERGWTLTPAGTGAQQERYLHTPDGAYIAWTPDGTVHTDANEQVTWTIAVGPPPRADRTGPSTGLHAPLLLDGVIVQRPLWTIQLTALTPLPLIDHIIDFLDNTHR